MITMNHTLLMNNDSLCYGFLNIYCNNLLIYRLSKKIQKWIYFSKKGANPDEKPPGGDTMLHEAAENGDLQTTRCLLEYGADPDSAL